MQNIICKYSVNVTEDVADVVTASASFFVLCDSDDEDDEQRRPPIHGAGNSAYLCMDDVNG